MNSAAKLRRPLIVTSILVVYSIWCAVSGLMNEGWLLLTSAAWLMVAAVGLFLRRPWARWMVLIYAVVASVIWTVIVAGLWWRGWPVDGAFMTIASLVPGLLFLAVLASICVALWRRPRAIPDDAA